MEYVNFLIAVSLAPIAAYFLYMGVKLLFVSKPEYSNLVSLQSSSGFTEGYMANFVDGGNGDYRIRRGLEASEDGKVILEQGAISTNALKTAFPH